MPSIFLKFYSGHPPHNKHFDIINIVINLIEEGRGFFIRNLFSAEKKKHL